MGSPERNIGSGVSRFWSGLDCWCFFWCAARPFRCTGSLVWPWVNVFLNMPALVVIVICYLGLGMTELAAVLAVVINKAPLIAVNVRDGVRQFESRYEEFAQVYELSRVQKLKLV